VSISEIGSASDPAVAVGVVEPPVLAAPARALDDTPARLRRLLGGESRSGTIQRALAVADALAAAAAVALALTLAGPDDGVAARLTWGLAYLPVVLVLLKLYGLYDRDRRRVSRSTLDDVPGVLHAALLATLVLWGTLKVAPAQQLILLQAALLLALTIVLVLAARARVRRSIASLVGPERVLVVGTVSGAGLLARKLRAGRAGRGLRPVGYLREAAAARDGVGLACLGTYAHLAEVCREHAVDRVMIASPGISHEALADLIRDANSAGVTVSLAPSAVDVLGPSTELDDLEGMMLLAVSPAQFSWSSRALKRSMDLVVAVAALPLLALALPIVAAAIKLDSPGPVFFRQDRLGRGGRRFAILKLRTMTADAEARVRDLQAQSAHPAWLVLDRDPRVTRLGRFLRTTSIDELPQLWNVLRGEMSLVGPRPMPVDTDRHINGWGRRRLDLTPGITGLWQVMGRASLSFEEMLELDYLYVTNWSLWGDVRLLLRTASVVLTRRGAN
jgi:exopolysaccharide biosynthesis polyprenyl glycosylphosphotransferase